MHKVNYGNKIEEYDDEDLDYYEDMADNGYQPDSYFLAAKEEIADMYEKNKESVYYMRQLQVTFEKKYFHWITRNAVTSLTKEGYLKQINKSLKVTKNIN